MHDFAIVKSIEGQKVEVVSLISNACVVCNSIDCAKKGKSFHVLNKKNLSIEENAIVRIGFSRVFTGILGLISLLFPIVSAAIGFFFSERLLKSFDFSVRASSQACVIGIFFTAAALIVFLVSRTDIHLSEPEILQVM
ncbi:MAG: SoxR reducing system RseC family protein [Treponema sp.]|nr:SoxR reducing system RseC family protein [Treponema sp.]